MPVPLTNTPVPAPSSTPVPRANTATATPVRLTATPTMPSAPPSVTPVPPTPTRKPTPKPGGKRPAALPLALSLPKTVLSGHVLTVGARTAAHGQITITLEVTKSTTTFTGTGKHRKRVVHTKVLYRVRVQGKADAHGRYTGHLRVTYHTAKPVKAQLVTSVRTPHGAATRTAQVTIRE